MLLQEIGQSQKCRRGVVASIHASSNNREHHRAMSYTPKPTCRTSGASLERAFAAQERHRAIHAHRIPNIIRIRRGLSCRHPHKPELSVSRGGARSQERIEDHQHHANHGRVRCFQHTKARSASSSQSQSAKHHEHQQGEGLPKKNNKEAPPKSSRNSRPES